LVLFFKKELLSFHFANNSSRLCSKRRPALGARRICTGKHILLTACLDVLGCIGMAWDVEFDVAFATEAKGFAEAARIEIAALAKLLREFGPLLRRPHCDTLKGSQHANMKELRFTLPDGEWRVAFAFDPQRNAILFVGGSKSGVNQKKFYKDLIRVADERFNAHLLALTQKDGEKK
jgi:hypothetical protein